MSVTRGPNPSKPNPTNPMRYVIAQWKGIKPAGSPSGDTTGPLLHEAERLAAIMTRVEPAHCFKAQGLEPDLPSFV